LTTDKIGYYVGGIIALANGSRKLDVAKARAMQLFRDADVRQREHLSVAQKVRDQLGQELNRHYGAAQQFIGEVLRRAERLGASTPGIDRLQPAGHVPFRRLHSLLISVAPIP
jgi:hypothetical protein